MKNTSAKKAVTFFHQQQGNFTTGLNVPAKKEADLAQMYYPGISAVMEKIAKKPESIKKYSRLQRTVAVISSRGHQHYPLLIAKAGLLAQVADVNAIPLMLQYGHPKRFAEALKPIANNFQAIFCTDLSPLEKKLLEDHYQEKTPLLFHNETEAAAVVSAVYSSCKFLKKTPKKIQISVTGEDLLAQDIIKMLDEEGFVNISIVDERGPLYQKRPNMNQQKKELVQVLKLKKDERTREELLAETDVYISTLPQNISSSLSGQLSDQCVIIALKAEEIKHGKKQAVVSTLPTQANHITDLHIAAGLIEAFCEGKKMKDTTLSKAIKGLAMVYKAPKKDRILPGLLEKNLSKKIAKAIS